MYTINNVSTDNTVNCSILNIISRMDKKSHIQLNIFIYGSVDFGSFVSLCLPLSEWFFIWIVHLMKIESKIACQSCNIKQCATDLSSHICVNSERAAKITYWCERVTFRKKNTKKRRKKAKRRAALGFGGAFLLLSLDYWWHDIKKQ